MNVSVIKCKKWYFKSNFISTSLKNSHYILLDIEKDKII